MASPIDASSCSPSPTPERSLCHEHMIRVKDSGLEIDSFGPKLKHPAELESTTVTVLNEGEANSATHVNSPEMRGDGVFLTWEDLCVTVSMGRSGCRSILEGLTGYARPGEVLVIMGPSGCGKSTLLDALAGRLGPSTRQYGNVHVNGRKQTLSFGNLAYVTQDNILMTTLTVGEAVYYSAQLQLPDMMSRSEKKERAEMTLREMGLQDTINTRIGGWGTKGISNGQKRRVSICIEILTHPKLLFLDEPTSGLDSAASYHVMNRIVNLAQKNGKTVIASIHQPSSEVFELFHNLCLLSCGKTIYFGAASAANEFFASNGLPCPTRRNESDHYLRMINKDFYEIKTADETIDILIQSYKLSDNYQQVLKQVAELCEREGESMEKKGSKASFLTQYIVLTKRSFVNMYRDLGYYWLRFATNITLCLCLGNIFYNVGASASYASIQARGSMLMFVASLMTFMSVGGFPSFVEDMKIFEHERLNGHYGTGAFVISNTLSSIPYLLLNSLIPGAIVYYLVGLQREFEHSLYFVLMLLVCTMLVESLMMAVASIVPNFMLGLVIGSAIQGLMMLDAGFFRLPNDLPKPFWRYPVYYIAFHKYAYQGFYKNELEGLTFLTNQLAGASTVTGEEILREVWQVEMDYSKWVDLAILFGMVVLYRLMFFLTVKAVEHVKPIFMSISISLSRLEDTDHGEPLPP
ncbi:ABC transporter G family member 1-like isoform X2 [Macadamia integrifolia]|uniref:ABC transporter G family member 1-like isoform X2 n=1 Tax=Macadamia integrifolia TaxID=60698 RepID=UPI001C4EE1A3|nr:ABC transporter G family member 1-like isoform X2 [Macadamia integrifolia]